MGYFSGMAASKLTKDEESPRPPTGGIPGVKPLPDDRDIPEGSGIGRSRKIPWPPADNGPKKPFKNLR